MAAPQQPAKRYIPKEFAISAYDAMILYENVIKAAGMEEIGYEDVNKSFREFIENAKAYKIRVQTHELESMLWACTALEEQGKFWHPTKMTLNGFISTLIHHKQFKFYFNKIYNFFQVNKPRRHVALTELIASFREKEGDTTDGPED